MGEASAGDEVVGKRDGPGDRAGNESRTQDLIMHYPHRTSRIKRKRGIGFRARMKTKHGRKMMNRKRKVGRSLNVADK